GAEPGPWRAWTAAGAAASCSPVAARPRPRRNDPAAKHTGCARAVRPRSHRPRATRRGPLPLGPGLPPGTQLLLGALLAERTVLHPQLEQMLVRLAHLAAGRQVEDPHDPVAVEVGTDPPDLLLLGEVVDAGLELVVGAGEGAGLAPVAGGDVGAGEAMEVLEQVAGVGDIAAHRRVGPRRVDIAVEAQMQLHQPRHLLGGVLVEGQGL